MSRFVMIDDQPECTRDMIQAAKEMAENVRKDFLDFKLFIFLV
jgi:hypothetical protein